MDFSEFARLWVAKHGLSDADADYGGMIGKAVLELAGTTAGQGHSGGSAAMVGGAFTRLLADYDNGASDVWAGYWRSDTGSALAAEHGLHPEEVIAANRRESKRWASHRK